MEQQSSRRERQTPEEFFQGIDVVPVSKEEFVEFVGLKYPKMPEEDIAQMKGINFPHEGQVLVLLRTDIFPEAYMPYLETHEKWEAYIAHKSGYNLFQKSARDYKRDRGIGEFDTQSQQAFFDEIGGYNYDFRHEFGVYKEYEHAMRDGVLEPYHQWFMDLREHEKLDASSANQRLIENDTRIRESVYKRLTAGSRRTFLRNG